MRGNSVTFLLSLPLLPLSGEFHISSFALFWPPSTSRFLYPALLRVCMEEIRYHYESWRRVENNGKTSSMKRGVRQRTFVNSVVWMPSIPEGWRRVFMLLVHKFPLNGACMYPGARRSLLPASHSISISPQDSFFPFFHVFSSPVPFFLLYLRLTLFFSFFDLSSVYKNVTVLPVSRKETRRIYGHLAVFPYIVPSTNVSDTVS